MDKRKKAPTTGRSLEFHLAMLGKSGNLTHADKRTKRNRDRASQRRAAIRDAS